MKYKTIIFDLDGTLLNTLEDIKDAINETFKNLNYPYIVNNEDTKHFIGYGMNILVNRVSEKFSFNEKQKEEFLNLYRQEYTRHVNKKTKPFVGVIEGLKKLKENGVKLGVISNKPNNDALKCIEHYFGNIFDFVIGNTEGIKIKPYPDIFYYMVNKFKFDRNSVLYVGDMDVDLIFSRNIDVDVAIVSYGYGEKETYKDANYIISDFSELMRIENEKTA